MQNPRLGTTFAAALTPLLAASMACAGGSPENVLVVINPASAESMYLGHYYQFARNVPASNVVYIDPSAVNYQAFGGTNGNVDAVFGKLNNSRLNSHIDYIVVASASTFFINAPGHVQDGCWPVARFSQTSPFALAFMRQQVLSNTLSSQEANHYFGTTAVAFDSGIAWLGGSPSTHALSRRYFITAQLGYTGALGNTVGEITAMIDRGVAADGVRPVGKFYFMNTTDALRNVRSPSFAGAVSAIQAAGGQAEIINSILPDFRHDCLGILTGWPDPNIEGSTYTLLPGAFCDHLTSWSATFDISQQTKMSAWIRRGAVGTCGTVEEPCNYLGKFPSPNLHVNYFRGLSLGEAWFRSMQYLPFQVMFQGDPLSRPYATIPVVNGNVPGGTHSGSVTFTPSASTTLPGAAIQAVELYIDGMLQTTKAPGSPFSINTAALSDGHHEVRVLAYDNTPVKTTGRWVGTFLSSNHGRSASLNLAPLTGTMTTQFTGNVAVTGAASIREVRLIQNGRVIAAAPSAPAALQVFGRNIGPGRSSIQAEVIFTDNIRAVSPPTQVDIAFTAGVASGQAPVAYSYVKRVMRGSSAVIELPASFDDALTNATFTLLTNPTQATVGTGTLGYRIITASTNACGPDPFTFRVTTLSGQSQDATVTLVYDAGPACTADFDNNNLLNANDFVAFINAYTVQNLRVDVNGDCNINAADFVAFLNTYAAGCP
jgi:uncharacterized protein (TIGR03790 family)